MSATNRFKIQPTIDVYTSAKRCLVEGATDADVNKGIKLKTNSVDTYELCAAGDLPEGFITAVERHTVGGKVVCAFMDSGKRWATAGAACNIGDIIDIHSVAALGTKDDMQRPVVKKHATQEVGDNFLWRIVSASTTDGVVAQGDNYVVIERI